MQDDNIKRRNDAIVAGRLFSGSVQDRETERCHHCGELLHPFPEPEYWMQYPLPTCCVLDGLKFCDDYRKPDCIAAYLVANPTPPEATTPAARRRTKARKSKPQTEDKDARIAALAATLPEDRAERIDQDGFARTGLTGEDVEPCTERDGDLLEQRKIPYAQTLQHGVPSLSE